jgi:hypothetical protein
MKIKQALQKWFIRQFELIISEDKANELGLKNFNELEYDGLLCSDDFISLWRDKKGNKYRVDIND